MREFDTHAAEASPLSERQGEATLTETVHDMSASYPETSASLAVPVLADARLPEHAPLPKPRFQVREQLGEGGGGAVFAVADEHLQRDVAIKVTHRLANTSEAARLIEEARLTARLEHPYILPVHDLGYDADGRCFFAMRKASGRTLAELIRDAASGDVHQVIATFSDRVALVMRVCEAIAYAHSRKVVHRDIKPSNIVVGEFGELIVLDWGTALDLCEGPGPSGKLIGTPIYMPPEQVRGEPANEQSDVYCLGATLWHLLALARPVPKAATEDEFWVHKSAGHLPDAPPGVPPTLLEIACKAMAPEQADRYETALALRSALATWERHQASIARCERTEQALSELERRGDHASFTRLTDDIRRALEDWPGNERAQKLLLRARRVHAAFALTRGELDLAGELVDPDEPDHSEVRDTLNAARARALAARRRAARLRWVTLALSLVVVAVAVALAIDYRRSLGAWHVAWVFVPARDPLGQIKSAFTEQASAPMPELASGALVLPRTHMFWLNGVTISGNVRFEAEIEWETAVDGFEISLRSQRNALQSPWLAAPGYTAQFGGYAGTVSFIAQMRSSGTPVTSNGVGIRFLPGRRYHVAFSVVGSEAALEVDGVEHYRLRDLLPLGDSTYNAVGIRTWGDVRVHRIEVRRQAYPEKPGPLVAGDVLLAAGHYAQAVRMYQQIAADFPASSAAEQALARAYRAAVLAPELAGERAPLLMRLLDEYPASRYREQCEEAAALEEWRAGRPAIALQRAQNVLTTFPRSRVALALLEHGVAGLPAEHANQLLGLVGRTARVSRVNISGLRVSDLSPLRNMSLSELDASGTEVSNLAPLRNMPLRRLVLDGTRVADLSPLSGMALEQLMLDSTRVQDLEVLRGMPLNRLHVRDTLVESLEPLRGAPLTQVDLRGSRVASLQPLQGAKLRVLRCSHTKVRSIRPIAGQPLVEAEIEGLELTEISALQGAPLRQLYAAKNEFSDISPISGARSWDSLDLSENQIADLTPLAGASGDRLALNGNHIADITPLRQATWNSILLAGNRITDASALSESHVTQLNLGQNPPLRLSVWNKPELQALSLMGTQLLDPDALVAFDRLSYLSVMGSLSDQAMLGLARKLEATGKRELSQSILVQRAFLAHDTAGLRRLATKVGGGQSLVYVPQPFTSEEARPTASSFGGSLPRLNSEDAKRFVMATLPAFGCVWIDLFHQEGRWRWGDGSYANAADVAARDASSGPQALAWYAMRVGGGLSWWSESQSLHTKADLVIAFFE
jgi:serine/threonine protein kinase/Leucine-rich repeat (LRR) protein